MAGDGGGCRQAVLTTGLVASQCLRYSMGAVPLEQLRANSVLADRVESVGCPFFLGGGAGWDVGEDAQLLMGLHRCSVFSTRRVRSHPLFFLGGHVLGGRASILRQIDKCAGVWGCGTSRQLTQAS